MRHLLLSVLPLSAERRAQMQLRAPACASRTVMCRKSAAPGRASDTMSLALAVHSNWVQSQRSCFVTP